MPRLGVSSLGSLGSESAIDEFLAQVSCPAWKESGLPVASPIHYHPGTTAQHLDRPKGRREGPRLGRMQGEIGQGFAEALQALLSPLTALATGLPRCSASNFLPGYFPLPGDLSQSQLQDLAECCLLCPKHVKLLGSLQLQNCFHCPLGGLLCTFLPKP